MELVCSQSKLMGIDFKNGGGGDYHYLLILGFYVALLKNIPLKVPLKTIAYRVFYHFFRFRLS
jgi:hypothetical protein